MKYIVYRYDLNGSIGVMNENEFMDYIYDTEELGCFNTKEEANAFARSEASRLGLSFDEF